MRSTTKLWQLPRNHREPFPLTVETLLVPFGLSVRGNNRCRPLVLVLLIEIAETMDRGPPEEQQAVLKHHVSVLVISTRGIFVDVSFLVHARLLSSCRESILAGYAAFTSLRFIPLHLVDELQPRYHECLIFVVDMPSQTYSSEQPQSSIEHREA